MEKSRKIEEKFEDLSQQAAQFREHFNNILEYSRDMLFCYNFETNQFEYISQSVEAFTGYSRQESIEQGVDLVIKNVHPDDKDAFMKLMNALKDSTFKEPSFLFDFRYKHKDGHYIWRSDQVNVQRDDSGKIIAVYGSIRDITAQKEYEAKLKAEKEHLKRLANATFDGIMIHNTRQIIETNSRFAEMFGYDPKELLQLSGDQFIHPDCLADLHEKMLAGYDKPYEVVCVRKDGSTFPARIQGHTYAVNGGIIRIAAIRDLTEEKERQAELQTTLERFKMLSEATFEAITVHDKGTLVESNQQFAEMFGYQLEELPGLDGLSLIAPECRDDVSKKIAEQYLEAYETMGLRKDGTAFPIMIRARMIDVEGRTLRIGVLRDLTEEKRQRRQLEESEKRYRELFRNSNIPMFQTRIDDGKIIECNNALVEMLGFESRQDCLNKGFSTNQYANPKERKKIIELLQKRGRIDNREIEFIHQNGSSIWVKGYVRINQEKGYLEGGMMDITASKILTKTEKKVLAIVLQGKSSKEIADILHRSIRTIEDHRSHIMHKLGATNLVELTQKASGLDL
jgi:PAS domain S-box-containing protein